MGLAETAVLAVEPGAAAQQVDHVLGVAAVEDREAGLETQGPPGAPEDGVGKGVERPARDAVAAAAHERRRARQHLLRRLAREREQEDLRRRHARLDQARDAVDERPRLAAPRTRDHQHGPVEHGGGLVLRGVQLAGIVDAEAGRGLGVGTRAQRVGIHAARSRL
jgi:hypothetical protein